MGACPGQQRGRDLVLPNECGVFALREEDISNLVRGHLAPRRRRAGLGLLAHPLLCNLALGEELLEFCKRVFDKFLVQQRRAWIVCVVLCQDLRRLGARFVVLLSRRLQRPKHLLWQQVFEGCGGRLSQQPKQGLAVAQICHTILELVLGRPLVQD